MSQPRKDERMLAVTPGDGGRKPHDYQQNAWNALSRHYGDSGLAGLLVIPTGGGKTFVAAHWLLQHHVRNGGRVLWLAHRRNLLVQAMEEFERLRGIAHPKPSLGLIRISSVDSAWPRVDKACDIVFSSLQTAIRDENRGFLERFLEESRNGTYVVVDEAHHAAAPSYARLLSWLRAQGVKLLGLTATPVRVDADDQKRLHALFDAKLIFQVTRRELTERKFLAAPIFETVKTEVNFEREFTEQDYAHLRKFGELGPKVLETLSRHAGRNRLIAETYSAKRQEYGTTLVFAADTYHAKTLAAEFQKHGIDADYVDYTRSDAASVMESYRQNKRPEVLVNVEMLTEGFDAPHTRTVFIARPTRSEGLLMQMVGRALRGRAAGGNERAYLVTFLDTWSQFDVLDARYVLEDGEMEELPPRTQKDPPQLVVVPYELIIEAYRLVQSVSKGFFHGLHQCLPHGWYAWEQLFENDLQRRAVMVFENQTQGYEALLLQFADPSTIPENLSEELCRDWVREYFSDLPDPLPRWQDLADLLSAKRELADVLYYTFDEKKAFDPKVLAAQFRERNLRLDEVSGELQALWEANTTCRHVYRGDLQSLLEEVHRELMQTYAPLAALPPAKLVDAVPKAPPAAWPAGEPGYSLVKIKDAVVSISRNFPQGTPRVSEVRWSKNASTSTWGFCRFQDNQIRINCVLNSPDIPLFVLEFLMHHELLHAEMPHAGHGADFRRREHAFVPSSEAIEDAKQRGILPGKSVDAWRVLGDQFLQTFDRYFAMKRPGTTMMF